MKIYLVILNDTSVDVDATPFISLEKAKEYARKVAKECCRGMDYEEAKPPAGWLLYIPYTCESFVFLIESELREEI